MGRKAKMEKALEKQFQNLTKLLDGAKNVLITAHKYPDGDALSSVLAFYLGLKGRNKINPIPYFSDMPKNYGFLPGFSEIETDFPKNKIDFLIGLDYGDFKRLDIKNKNFPDKKIITIDHHLPSDHRGNFQIVRPDFSSTSEILYYFFKNAKILIDKEIATCLLTGIYTDSGGFKHAATSSLTLGAAADLISRGASLPHIVRGTITMKSPSVLKLWGRALSRVEHDSQTGMVYSWIAHKDLKGKIPENLGVGDLAADISMRSGAPFTLLLVEHRPGRFKGSLRSESYHNVDVAKIAKALGGGGHKLSAGFEKKGDLKNIIQLVKATAGIKREIA